MVSRHLLVLAAAPILISCLAPAGAPAETQTQTETKVKTEAEAVTSSPAAAPAPAMPANSCVVTSAMEAFEADVWTILTLEHYQWVIAICSVVLGLAALWDGRAFFKILVTLCAGGMAFIVVLSQLRPSWTGEVARLAKYVASLEAGVFVGWAAYAGWDGSQLLLGLTFGMYVFHCLQGTMQVISQSIPYVDFVANHSIWLVSASTLSVVFGAWALHEKYGAGRVLGVLAPVFGGSLIVATCGYLWMLLCAVSPVGTLLHATVLPADVPSVFEFWYMIACPMRSQAVGFFNFTNRDITIRGSKFELDRDLGLLFWVIISLLGAARQLKKDQTERKIANDAIQVRLIQRGAAGTSAPPASAPPAPSSTFADEAGGVAAGQ